MVKRSATITTATSKKKWDKLSFFDEASTQLDDAGFQGVEELFNQCVSLGLEVTWGTGTRAGSFSAHDRSICKGSFLTVRTDGTLITNFGNFYRTQLEKLTRDRLRRLISEGMGLRVEGTSKYPEYRVSDWISRVGVLVAGLQEILAEFRDKGCLTA